MALFGFHRNTPSERIKRVQTSVRVEAHGYSVPVLIFFDRTESRNIRRYYEALKGADGQWAVYDRAQDASRWPHMRKKFQWLASRAMTLNLIRFPDHAARKAYSRHAQAAKSQPFVSHGIKSHLISDTQRTLESLGGDFGMITSGLDFQQMAALMQALEADIRLNVRQTSDGGFSISNGSLHLGAAYGFSATTDNAQPAKRDGIDALAARTVLPPADFAMLPDHAKRQRIAAGEKEYEIERAEADKRIAAMRARAAEIARTFNASHQKEAKKDKQTARDIITQTPAQKIAAPRLNLPPPKN